MSDKETKEIDYFIDDRLFAIPYDGNVKEMLTEEETKVIENFADNLKKVFKYINQNLDKEQRRKKEFTPNNIKEKFDCIMLAFYGKKLFDILNQLYRKSSYHGQQLIDEFYFHKQNQYSRAVGDAERYKKELKDILHEIKIKNEIKNR